MPDASISSIRSRFPVFQKKIYLNSCSQGALSDRVEAGFQEYLRVWHEQGSPWDVWVQHYEAARSVFARLIGAETDEVALVASASAGVNGIASALTFRERNRVVLGEFEFPTMGHIWMGQRPRGAEVVFVAARNDRLAVEDYAKLIDRKTVIVPMTHICFRNGFRMPVREIVRMAHDHGALALLDDYQDCGTRPIDVKAMDLDFYVSGTLKYLLGPPGLAFMYVRKSLAEHLTPTITGWFGQANPFAFNEQLLESGSEHPPVRVGDSSDSQYLRCERRRRTTAGNRSGKSCGPHKDVGHIPAGGSTKSAYSGEDSLRQRRPTAGAEGDERGCAGAEIRGRSCCALQPSRRSAHFVSRL